MTKVHPVIHWDIGALQHKEKSNLYDIISVINAIVLQFVEPAKKIVLECFGFKLFVFQPPIEVADEAIKSSMLNYSISILYTMHKTQKVHSGDIISNTGPIYLVSRYGYAVMESSINGIHNAVIEPWLRKAKAENLKCLEIKVLQVWYNCVL